MRRELRDQIDKFEDLLDTDKTSEELRQDFINITDKCYSIIDKIESIVNGISIELLDTQDMSDMNEISDMLW